MGVWLLTDYPVPQAEQWDSYSVCIKMNSESVNTGYFFFDPVLILKWSSANSIKLQTTLSPNKIKLVLCETSRNTIYTIWQVYSLHSMKQLVFPQQILQRRF